MGTIIVGLILLIVVAIILYVMVKDKRKGVSSCGKGCASCPSRGTCGNG